jgi:hypothetical protein
MTVLEQNSPRITKDYYQGSRYLNGAKSAAYQDFGSLSEAEAWAADISKRYELLIFRYTWRERIPEWERPPETKNGKEIPGVRIDGIVIEQIRIVHDANGQKRIFE